MKRLLENKGNNYIFPFFWQHGESEGVLREYMKVIRESNIRAVCVESRPHPDFLGEKWWKKKYRHFGQLMAYANRVCELLSDGKHIAPVGILYQAESDWTGKCVMMQEAAMQLADWQIDYDFIPSDVFEQREGFHTRIGKTLKINHQEYQILLVPEYEYITKAAAAGIREFLQMGGTVIFNGQTPKVIGAEIEIDEVSWNTEKETAWALGSLHISLAETGEKTAQLLEKKNAWDVQIVPAARRIRYLHY